MFYPEIKITNEFKALDIKISSLKNTKQIQKDLVLYGDNEMRNEARITVYSYKPKNPSKRTGNTYRAIKTSYLRDTAIISPNSTNAGLSSVDYSPFIEFGNKKTKVPARPYVNNTFEKMKKKLKDIINKYVN